MHLNNGNCPQCIVIRDHYPNFSPVLWSWFADIQLKHPDAHISCAGRGSVDQEVCYQRGASKAHYGESSHNYNCAIDIFQLEDGQAKWPQEWFDLVVGANLTPKLKWYGAPGAIFYELAHVELTNWRELADMGSVTLVE